MCVLGSVFWVCLLGVFLGSVLVLGVLFVLRFCVMGARVYICWCMLICLPPLSHPCDFSSVTYPLSDPFSIYYHPPMHAYTTYKHTTIPTLTETSLTIPDVVHVIDTGLVKVCLYTM